MTIKTFIKIKIVYLFINIGNKIYFLIINCCKRYHPLRYLVNWQYGICTFNKKVRDTCFVSINTCECNIITYDFFKSQTIYRPDINYLFSFAIYVSLLVCFCSINLSTVCTNKRFRSTMDVAPERKILCFIVT